MFEKSHIKRYLAGLFLLALIISAWPGCDSKNSKITEPELAPLKVSSVVDSGCKFQKVSQVTDSVYLNQSCLHFTYDGTNKLQLKHINTVFNCCPDSIWVEVDRDDNLITITNKESLESGGCFCLCLYDLEYTIEGILPGEYTFNVVEKYQENDPLLQFSVDLRDTPSGFFCVGRDGYPWGINQNPLTGDVTYVAECKESIGSSSQAFAADSNCVSYSYNYDGFGVLSIDRTNAIFNCCADSFAVAVHMVFDTIVIEETEHFVNDFPCRCICPFDLSYNLDYISPGQYTVMILSPYQSSYSPEDTLLFNIDLIAEPDGEYCIEGM